MNSLLESVKSLMKIDSMFAIPRVRRNVSQGGSGWGVGKGGVSVG